MTNLALSVRGLSKCFRLRTETPGSGLFRGARSVARWLRRPARTRSEGLLWALRDVSFDVARGERVAIIGRNGAGKSTLLKILSRVIAPTAGEARIRGRLSSLLEVGTGFNEQLSGRENVFLNASLYGAGRAEITRRFDEIVEFSGVGKFIDMPLKNYSSGMRARLAFAVAAHLEPDILLLDEVLAVGDLNFQQKCLNRVRGMMGDDQRTLLFVSHSMDSVRRFCDRCLWLDQGRLVTDGPVVDVINNYSQAVLEVCAEFDGSPSSAFGDHAEPAGAPWDDRSCDPRERAAALIGCRVIDDELRTVQCVAVDQRVGIEMSYRVVRTGEMLMPGVRVRTEDDCFAFVTVPTTACRSELMPDAGAYTARVWVPPNLLNSGKYLIDVCVIGPDERPIKRHFDVSRALSFIVVEAPADGREVARGWVAGKFPGAVRPKLPWEIERQELVGNRAAARAG